jgi:hypothetical protein
MPEKGEKPPPGLMVNIMYLILFMVEEHAMRGVEGRGLKTLVWGMNRPGYES